mgnify:FL=1
MDTSPRVYLWGFTPAEKEHFDAFLEEMGAPCATGIDPVHANLTVHEILFSEKTEADPVEPDTKVVLFFNVPAETIHKVMRGAKNRDLPQTIYAMVTRENIAWRFTDLVDHLKREHEFVQRRMRERTRGHAGDE